jgi:DNA-binding Lrp family transcriptional regulator
MKKTLLNSGFDKLDYAILNELQANGRVSVADLARKVFLSQPAVHNRIKRLEKAGVIRGYAALVDREAAGYDLLCFIRVSVQTHTRDLFDCWEERIHGLPQVIESYRTAGSYDLLLKVVVGDHKALDQFIGTHLMTLPGVEKIETTLVLNEIKTTTMLPLK